MVLAPSESSRQRVVLLCTTWHACTPWLRLRRWSYLQPILERGANQRHHIEERLPQLQREGCSRTLPSNRTWELFWYSRSSHRAKRTGVTVIFHCNIVIVVRLVKPFLQPLLYNVAYRVQVLLVVHYVHRSIRRHWVVFIIDKFAGFALDREGRGSCRSTFQNGIP